MWCGFLIHNFTRQKGSQGRYQCDNLFGFQHCYQYKQVVVCVLYFCDESWFQSISDFRFSFGWRCVSWFRKVSMKTCTHAGACACVDVDLRVSSREGWNTFMTSSKGSRRGSGTTDLNKSGKVGPQPHTLHAPRVQSCYHGRMYAKGSSCHLMPVFIHLRLQITSCKA